MTTKDNRSLASAGDFDRVMPGDLQPENQGRLVVHVSGWAKGMKFVWMGCVDGLHLLQTPKTRKLYGTRNPLLHLRTPTRFKNRITVRLKDLF